MNPEESRKFLYEHWRRTAQENRRELALLDVHSGKSWTFEALRREGEKPCDNADPIVFPHGHGPEFIISLLRSWREGRVLCPLETGQSPPAIPEPPSHCVHLKLTSATGGAPKCIAFTGPQLAADARNIVSTKRLSRDWPNLASISMAHSYGFSNLVLPLVLHGIPLLIAPATLPEIILRAAKSFPALTIPAVPALWRTWLAAQSIPANTRLAISAGAPLPLDLERQIFVQTGTKVHNFYGSSECGGIAYDRTEVPREDAAFAGTALDNANVSLSESGTLIVSGDSVAEGYWPEPSPNLGRRRFETTDLAEIVNGAIFLRGRAGDLINVAGRKVLPETIEAALRNHSEIEECVVFGVPEKIGDRMDSIAACIHPRHEVGISELVQFLSAKLPAWQIPRQWWFTSELGPNQRGKISRAHWRERFIREREKSPEPK